MPQPGVRKAVVICVALQALQQLCGINAIVCVRRRPRAAVASLPALARSLSSPPSLSLFLSFSLSLSLFLSIRLARASLFTDAFRRLASTARGAPGGARRRPERATPTPPPSNRRAWPLACRNGTDDYGLTIGLCVVCASRLARASSCYRLAWRARRDCVSLGARVRRPVSCRRPGTTRRRSCARRACRCSSSGSGSTATRRACSRRSSRARAR